MHKRIHNLWRMLIVLTVLSLGVAACSTAPAGTAPTGDSEGDASASTTASSSTSSAGQPAGAEAAESLVRIRTTSSVGTHFNPLWFIGTGSQWHTFPFIWYPLVFYNADSQMEPWLAESIDVSEDAKTWTFHLHENATWSDGEPVTAEDVKWSWELLMNPATTEIGAVGIFVRDYIEGAEALLAGESDEITGIVVVDDKTVQFNLAEPNPLFLYDAYVFVMPKHVLGDVPILELPNHPYVDNPTVTSGPYRLAQYEPRNFIELEVSDTWWGEQQPAIDRVVLIQPASAETALNMLEAGEMDMSPYLSINDVERIERMPGMRAVVQLTPGISHLVVNQRHEYLQDKRVRQALAHAIDRTVLNEIEYAGQAVPIYSDIFMEPWASPDITVYDYNPDKARALLEEAGWDFDRTLVYWSNTPPEEVDVRALYLQDALGEIGVELEIATRQYSAVADAHSEGFYDLTSLGGGSHALDPNFAIGYYVCGGTWSTWLGYCNERLEELRLAGMSSSDPAARQAAYQEASLLMNDELPFIYLFRPPTVYAVSDRLAEFEPPIWFRHANSTMMDWQLSE